MSDSSSMKIDKDYIQYDIGKGAGLLMFAKDPTFRNCADVFS